MAAGDETPRRADEKGRIFRALRIGSGGERNAGRFAKGVFAAILHRQRFLPPHAPVPAASDQTVLRALRRYDRARGLYAAGGRGVCLYAQQKHQGAGTAGRPNGTGQRGNALRTGGRFARPHPRPEPDSNAKQRFGRHRRLRCRGDLYGQGTKLRAGVFLPRRAQLR